MKNFRGLICLAFAISFVAPPVFGQWKQAAGPHGGNVTCFARLGKSIYAGTIFSGVYRSDDNGVTWRKINTSRDTDLNLNEMISRDGTLIGAGGVVLVSDDSGATWTVKNKGLQAMPVRSIIAIDSELIAGGDLHGAFRSTNNGDSWTPTDSGLPDGYISVFSFAWMDTLLFAGSDKGMFLSGDSGRTWSAAGLSDSTVYNVAICDTSVFAITTNRGFFRSTDKGTSWGRVGGQLTDSVSCIRLAISSNRFYLGTYDGVYVSTDIGNTWQAAGLRGRAVQSFGFFDGNILAGTRANGVFRSTDDGSTWTGTGLPCKGISLLAAVGRKMFAEVPPAGGVDPSDVDSSNEGLLISDDGGSSWKSAGFTYGQVRAVTTYAGTFYAAGDSGVFRSSDEGATWLDAGMSREPVNALAATNTRLIAGTAQGVFLSTDNGGVWDTTDLRAKDPGVIALLAVSDTSLYALTNSGVFRSVDGGASWKMANNGLTYERVNSLAALGDTIFAGTSSNGVFATTNNGGKWLGVNSGVTNHNIQCLASARSRVFAGAMAERIYSEATVFFSPNGGSRWGVAREGFPGEVVSSLLVVGDTLYAATSSSGLWSRPISELTTGIPGGGTHVASGFVLEQNFPNPFNPSTAIRYQLSAVSHVTLRVYDVLGRAVATLVNGVRQPGSYDVSFDGSGLPSGVYFCRLDAGGFHQTRKLLLLK